MDRQVTVGVFLAVFIMAASGCLIISGKTVHESGVKITDSTLRQIRIGETTEAWILATLGEPTTRTEVEDGTVMLRYDHCITRAEGGAVFLIFAGGSETRTRSSTYFEIRDGIVTRVWSEST